MSEKFGGLTTTPIKPSAFGGGSGGIVDQTYNPESENPQSGKAVAEAVADKMDKFGELSTDEFGYRILDLQGGLRFTTDEILDLQGKTLFLNAETISLVGKVIKHAGMPKSGDDVANKQYVDNALGDIDAALDELHAYARAVINGGATE